MTTLNIDPSNPLDAVEATVTYAADDWSMTPAMAWVYGIVVGWDDFDLDVHGSAMDEVADLHGWGPERVELLRTLRAEWVAITSAFRAGLNNGS